MNLQGVDRRSESRATAHGGERVAILLATMNGSAFIDEQLDSIAAQTHDDWFLLVSDDGSTDDTRERVARFAASRPQRVVLVEGPRRGACANFLKMAADPAIDADYYAFCDQDDIWYADKLERALAVLAGIPVGVPALYGGRTELVDIDGRPYGFSPLFKRHPDFRNALVQSIIGGNTIVFNRPTKKLIETGGTPDIASHDWWAYQLVSLAGGVVHYDPQPAVRYRQHGKNLVGSTPRIPGRDAAGDRSDGRPLQPMESLEPGGPPATAGGPSCCPRTRRCSTGSPRRGRARGSPGCIGCGRPASTGRRHSAISGSLRPALLGRI